MSRSSVNSADLFCYVCGEVTLASQAFYNASGQESLSSVLWV